MQKLLAIVMSIALCAAVQAEPKKKKYRKVVQAGWIVRLVEKTATSRTYEFERDPSKVIVVKHYPDGSFAEIVIDIPSLAVWTRPYVLEHD